ncbi:MAG: twin-arginine translocation signal domain-containing protein [Chitinophagaceae bacterium]|nr:MAG: twin-arginine translocation signal domain-containing protein [Chitinophagaceae bacterium]
MKNDNYPGRREFLGTLTAGAAAMGIAGIVAPIQQAQAGSGQLANTPLSDAEEWFKKIKGKHRMVFDVTQPHEIFPFAWPRVFLMTNEMTGTGAKDCSVVVVLRHDAIPYAMQNELWAKYNFGEVFKAEDPSTKKHATRNPFWKPAKGDYKVPGIGEVAIGINELQESGVMFCVCEAALTVYSAALADKLKVNAADLKKEWIAGLLPGVQPVPSGVWAIGRAQENGCSYCFAG